MFVNIYKTKHSFHSHELSVICLLISSQNLTLFNLKFVETHVSSADKLLSCSSGIVYPLGTKILLYYLKSWNNIEYLV